MDELSRRPAAAVRETVDALYRGESRRVFTCCHPVLSPEAQVALTLREVCGLTTEEIARAFLAAPPALAQRIVRAKAKIRDARIPYEVPPRAELPGRPPPPRPAGPRSSASTSCCCGSTRRRWSN